MPATTIAVGMMVIAAGEMFKVCRVLQDGYVVLTDETGQRMVYTNKNRVEALERREAVRNVA